MRILLSLLVLLIFVSTSRSQVIDGVEIVRPRIIAGDWDPVTKRFPVAIEFTIAPEWHMYWLNPGDAGSPPKVEWKLPSGWMAMPLEFPVPKKVEEEGMVSYAYYDKLVLHGEIYSHTKPAKELVETRLKWMVCKDICVAGEDTLKVYYDAAVTPYEWPVRPIIPVMPYRYTIDQAWMDLPNGEMQLAFQLQAGCLIGGHVKDFYPLPPDDQPLDIVIDNAFDFAIRARGLNAKGRIESTNGLIITNSGEAIWLKPPILH